MGWWNLRRATIKCCQELLLPPATQHGCTLRLPATRRFGRAAQEVKKLVTIKSRGTYEGIETSFPAPVVALCILNTFLSYIQHLHYKSYINQSLEQGLGSRCLCPSVNVPATRLQNHTCCFSLFATDKTEQLFIYAKRNRFSNKVCEINKIFLSQECKAFFWRICYPALCILWLVILETLYMCLPHASGIQFPRRYRWRNCACGSCQAWITHGEFSSADTERLLDMPRSETLGTCFNIRSRGL